MEGGEGVKEEGGKLGGDPCAGSFLPGEGDGKAEGELGGGDLAPGQVGGGEVSPGQQVSPVVAYSAGSFTGVAGLCAVWRGHRRNTWPRP